MNATVASPALQQKRIASYRSNDNHHRFFNLLTSDTLLSKVEELLPEHRERLYPPTETLSMFLAQAMSADRSCQQAVNQAALNRLVVGLPANSVHTGGYCRARQRLPTEMVSALTRYVGQLTADQAPSQWHWRGRRVRLIDGTTVTMPDTPANQQAYPQLDGQQVGLGFPICRIVGVICLASGAVLNAAMGPFKGKGGDERALLRSLMSSFESGDLILGDALFATYFFIAAMQEKGVDILMQQQGGRSRVADFRRGKKLGERDHLIVLKKPKLRPEWMSEEQYNQAPSSLTVRECRVSGKTLVTTLLCSRTTPKADLKSLYRQRWHVELDLRNIKTTMGMETLSCKTPAMAEKEFWVYVLAYNLIRLIMAQSALLADTMPRKLSFKHCLQLWSGWLRLNTAMAEDQLTGLCVAIAQKRVGNRAGRIEPRAVKRRPKQCALLMMERELAREQVRKHGHFRKPK